MAHTLIQSNSKYIHCIHLIGLCSLVLEPMILLLLAPCYTFSALLFAGEILIQFIFQQRKYKYFKSTYVPTAALLFSSNAYLSHYLSKQHLYLPPDMGG